MRNTRTLSWIKAALKDFGAFPRAAQDKALSGLTMIAEGGTPDIAKPLTGLGPGIWELAIKERGDAFRVVYALQLDAGIWVVHAFQKKSKRGIATPKHEIDLVVERIKRLKGGSMMNEEIETVRGSGNVFADLGRDDADVLQLKAILAAEIVRTLATRELTVRRAEDLTGIAAADFSRIRQARLERFTVDRLMAITRRLGREAEVAVSFSQRTDAEFRADPA